jgi:hypothetical protein
MLMSPNSMALRTVFCPRGTSMSELFVFLIEGLIEAASDLFDGGAEAATDISPDVAAVAGSRLAFAKMDFRWP